MPVSHIGLTVSHLPTSCSFFLSALQPLGYRFIGQQGNQIGLGINDADFFLCQETPGVKAGAAHIAFSAPSRTAVRDFYASALNAGGRPNGSPATRNEENGYFNAAVLDFDGNSIEVVFRNEPDMQDDGTVIEHSRVLTWQRSVAESVRDDQSVASASTVRSSYTRALVPAASTFPSKAPTKAPSVASGAASMVRSVSAPVAPPQSTTSSNGDGAAKKIIGTLLGAAAGAAVAYAMCKSEQDSAKKEAEFNARQQTQGSQSQPQGQPQLQASSLSKEQLKLALQDPQPIYESPPRTIHRNISDTDSWYSTPNHRSAWEKRAIEPAPTRSYHSPTYTTIAPTAVSERKAIEYMPATASTILPPRSQFSVHRSVSSPESVHQYQVRRSVLAPSTLISSFVASEVRPPSERRSSAESVHSHRSSKSKAKSSHSHASKHASESKHSSRSHSRASSPPSTATSQSKPASIVGSILGREASIHTPSKQDNLSIADLPDDIDLETVVPSDSISNAGSSRRSHHSHRSSSKAGGSTHSKHSSSSKHSHRSSSRKSHHSSSKKSHHSSRSSHHRNSDNSDPEYHSTVEANVIRPSTIISEPSDASTVKPSKPRCTRTDSVIGPSPGMAGESGTVVSLPVRGITPSMIEESRGEKKGRRSVASYAMGQ